MAQEYDNTNRGSIWKNEDKDADTHPDFKGSLNVDGTEYWVSAWKRKEGANPKAPALSFTVKAKEGQTKTDTRQPAKAQQKPNEQKPGSFDDFEDDIPF
jgi:hypothetical protein